MARTLILRREEQRAGTAGADCQERAWRVEEGLEERGECGRVYFLRVSMEEWSLVKGQEERMQSVGRSRHLDLDLPTAANVSSPMHVNIHADCGRRERQAGCKLEFTIPMRRNDACATR